MSQSQIKRKAVGELAREANAQRRGALPALLACLITIIVVDVLVRALVDGIVTQNAPDWPFNPAVSRMAGMVASRFLEVVGVLAALSILFRVMRYGSFGDLGLGRQGLKWLPAGLLTPLLALALAALILYVIGVLPVDRLLYPGPWPTALALAAATQAAWIEELIFRGTIMQAVERVAGAGRKAKIVAILVSGALFASLHIFAPFQLTWAWWVTVVIAGLGFGYAFYAAGRNLWVTIGLHWGFDLGVFLLLGVPGETRGWINSRLLGVAPSLSQPGGYIMIIAALLTALALVLLLHRDWKEETA